MRMQVQACNSYYTLIGKGRYADDNHRRIWCLNHRDELYRSTFDLYSRRKEQISDASIIEMSSTQLHRDKLKLSFTDSTNPDRLPFKFKETNLDTLSFTKNSDRLRRTHTILNASHRYRQTACTHVHECYYSRHMLYIASMSFINTYSQLYNNNMGLRKPRECMEFDQPCLSEQVICSF